MKTKKLEIKQPSVTEVENWLQIWKTSDEYEKYRCQEKSVVMVFQQYPKNTEIKEVLIKVGILNDFYSTNIFDTFSVAKNIVKQNIDSRLSNANTDIINDIAQVNINGKDKRFYSFATKYCSNHYPEKYPIYDSIVNRMLVYFKTQEEFAKFKQDDLRDYLTFKNIIIEFRKFYDLEKFSFREIDWYLWLVGKEYFNTKNENVNIKN